MPVAPKQRRWQRPKSLHDVLRSRMTLAAPQRKLQRTAQNSSLPRRTRRST
ncbi:hypothetical protein L810_6896 [Burkholderia sp. AU4i]|nr:hypothetical protein L810_6896 [Burkholderia sp. AU4i]